MPHILTNTPETNEKNNMSEQRNRMHKGKLNENFRNKTCSNQNEAVKCKAQRLEALNLNREL